MVTIQSGNKSVCFSIDRGNIFFDGHLMFIREIGSSIQLHYANTPVVRRSGLLDDLFAVRSESFAQEMYGHQPDYRDLGLMVSIALLRLQEDECVHYELSLGQSVALGDFLPCSYVHKGTHCSAMTRNALVANDPRTRCAFIVRPVCSKHQSALCDQLKKLVGVLGRIKTVGEPDQDQLALYKNGGN